VGVAAPQLRSIRVSRRNAKPAFAERQGPGCEPQRPAGARVGFLALTYTDGVGSPADTSCACRPWLAVTLALTALLQIVVVNFWPGFESPNERARAYQALAVAGRGSLEIGPEVERFGGMEDLAVTAGGVFPNKAPGMLPLLLPGAAIARAVAGPNPEAELRLTLVLDRLVASSLPFALCVLLLALHTGERFPRGAPLAVAAYALATPALAASLLLFSHALSACLLLAGFLLLFGRQRPRWQTAPLAGALLAWAAVCEYPVALPAAVLALVALPRLRVRGALAGLLGGAVPMALLGVYNLACFGSPLAISTAHESYGAFAALVRRGFFGLSWPTPGGLAGLLASPSRGLLAWAPLVALAALGAVRRRTGAEGRGSTVALVTAPLVLLVAMSGYPNWHGGWFAGPRYLLPVLPLLFVLVAGGAERLATSRWGGAATAVAALWGWLQVWPVVASFPFPPEDHPLPFATLARGLLADGILVPSWLPPPVEAVVLAVLAAGAAVLLFTLATGGARPLERAVAVGLSLIALGLVLGVRAPVTWKAALERAVIRDVYTRSGKGALEALLPRADTPERRAALEAWIALRDRP